MEKIVRIITVCLASILLSFAILSMLTRNVLVDAIANNFVKQRVSSKIVTEVIKNEHIDSKTIHKINEDISNNEELKKISNKYLDTILKDILYNRNESKIDVSKNFEKIVNSLNDISEEQKKNINTKLSEKDLTYMYDLMYIITKSSITYKNFKYLKFYLAMDKLKILFLVIGLIMLGLVLLKSKLLDILEFLIITFSILSVSTLLFNIYIKKILHSIIPYMDLSSINISYCIIINIVFALIAVIISSILLIFRKKLKKIKI